MLSHGNFCVSVLPISSKYFPQCLCLTAFKVKTFKNRYFQLPLAFFALFQYLKSYGKQGWMFYFQRQGFSEEMQSHKTFRVEVGRAPEHSGSNSILQTATASHKACFPKPLDHEDSLNLSFVHPCLRRSSGEQTHQKPGIVQPACCQRDTTENEYVQIATASPTSTCKAEVHKVKSNVFAVKPLDQELGDLSFHQSYKKFLVDKPHSVLWCFSLKGQKQNGHLLQSAAITTSSLEIKFTHAHAIAKVR